MKFTVFIMSICFLGNILPLFAVGLQEKEKEIFYQNNTDTALPVLRKALQNIGEPPVPPYKIAEVQRYISEHENNIKLLEKAAELPNINFSYCETLKKPCILPFGVKLPKAIRLLMYNYYYGVHSNNSKRVLLSLITSLKLDSKLVDSPFIIGQLIRTSIINIIFAKCRDAKKGKGFEELNDKDLQKIINLLKDKEQEFLIGYIKAFLNESQIPSIYIIKYFKSCIKNITDIRANKNDSLINRYRKIMQAMPMLFCYSPNEVLFNDVISKAKSLNNYFKNDIVQPLRWRDNYIRTISRLMMLRIAFSAIKFKNNNKRYPSNLKQFMHKEGSSFIFQYKKLNENGFEVTSPENEKFIYMPQDAPSAEERGHAPLNTRDIIRRNNHIKYPLSAEMLRL